MKELNLQLLALQHKNVIFNVLDRGAETQYIYIFFLDDVSIEKILI